MKRVLCLFLCLLILFCIGCKKEETPTPPNSFLEEFVPEISADSFYTYDGDLHNIYVNLTLTTTELTAPVTTLSFELRNDSDYTFFLLEQLHPVIWEKWENGRWRSFYAPYDTRSELDASFQQVLPHKVRARTDDFTPSSLDVGVYRLRIEYTLTNEKGKVHNQFVPGVECVVETYFTILPAPQG